MGVIWNWACALLFLTAAVSSTLFYNPTGLSESVTHGVMTSPNTSDSGFSSSQEEWIRHLVASHAALTSTPTASSSQSGAQTQSTTATTTGSSQQGSLGKPMRCISSELPVGSLSLYRVIGVGRECLAGIHSEKSLSQVSPAPCKGTKDLSL